MLVLYIYYVYFIFSNIYIVNYTPLLGFMKKGLINHAQNCYINSMIQAFYTVPTIQYFIKNLPSDYTVFEQYKKRTRSDGEFKDFFLPAFKKVFSQLDNQTSDSGDPICLLDALKLDPGIQEDVADIYMRIQNYFDDYCQSMDIVGIKFSNMPKSLTQNSTNPINCTNYYNMTFNFSIQVKQKCHSCEKITELPQENNYSLNILPKSTLFEGINTKFNEIMSNCNKCTKCGTKMKPIEAKITAPRALVIQLERNQAVYGNELQKSMKATLIPLFLDMKYLGLYFKFASEFTEKDREQLVWILLQPWLFFESQDGVQLKLNDQLIYGAGINQSIINNLLQQQEFTHHVKQKYTGRVKNPFSSGSQWNTYQVSNPAVHWSLTEPELRKDVIPSNELYRIQGFIVHKGIAYAGHYYYLCLDPKAPGDALELTMYNDRQVLSMGNSSQKYINMYNIVNNFGAGQPALYFYERVDSQKGAAW